MKKEMLPVAENGDLDPKAVIKEYLTITYHGAISGKTQAS